MTGVGRTRRVLAGRVLAGAGVAALVSGLALGMAAIPVGAAAASSAYPSPSPPFSTASATGSATPSPTASASGTGTGTTGTTTPGTSTPVTVQGPVLYNGTTGPLANPSSVTASQTTDLVNQTVQVSWANFTPSSSTAYDTQSSLYAVMVAECIGSDPTSWSKCYGASNAGVEGSSGSSGPYNAVYDTTAPDGSGVVDINVETGLENSFLGCDAQHPCSLVVVPGQGGNESGYPNTKFDCADHSDDSNTKGGYAEPSYTFSATTGYCSWADRIVIPLQFSPAVNGCPLTSTQFSLAGSPMMSRAMLQWLSGLCQGSNPLAISYNSEVQEPQALLEASSGMVDVALTTRPASADTEEDVTMPSYRHFVYTPIAVSAAVVAYWVDSPTTGQPISGVKLDPRLITKLITTSYSFGDGCVKGVPPPSGIGYCDKAVSGNPFGIFQDPEFKKLNPGVQPVTGQGGTYQVPTVQSGNSDMTWTLTRWIEANGAAVSFLNGQPDQWGMHVNTYYKGVSYPTDSFIGQDPYPFIQHLFNPLYPLSEVAYHQSLNWDAGTTWQKDQFGNYPADTPEIPGQRALFAILDDADAAAFEFPVAAIPNAAGDYVQPTDASMAAALQDMTGDGSGTEQVNLTSSNPAAYPLTMVVYAAVPTACTPPAKASAIARFLDYASSTGQVQGDQPGQLPTGYLPLPASMEAQTKQVAATVAGQSYHQAACEKAAAASEPSSGLGATPVTTTSQVPLPLVSSPAQAVSSSARTGSGHHHASASPSRSVTPSPSPAASATISERITTTTIADPQQAAGTRYVLPALLVFGGLAALGGSSALLASATTSVVALVRARLIRTRLVRSRRIRPRLSRGTRRRRP
jgi:hypothetical protein